MLELMSCGGPVVAPRIGALPDIFDHGVDGLLYDTEDGFASHLERLLLILELRRKYKKN